MQSRRRMRIVGVFFLSGCVALLGCSGEQYEKPEKKEPALEQPAEAPKAAPPTEVPAPEPTAVPEVPTPEPTAEPVEEPEEAAVEEPAPEPVAAVEDEGEDGSDLTLLGIVRAGRSPSALIEYRGSQEIFRKGETVFGQGKLTEFRNDAVVLDSGDGKVTLQLPSPKADEPPPTPEPLAVESSAPASAEPAPPPVAQAISRGEAQTALRSFSQVLEKASAQRVSTGGGHGIQLGNVGSDSFLGKLGLKSGDILQKINDATLSDPEKLPDLSNAASGGEIAITFVRDEIGLTFSRKLR